MKKILLIVAATLFIASCSKKGEETNNQAQQQTQTSSTSDYQKTDFYFKLPDKDGGEIDLANFKGKPVMVMFFTENCPYCRKAAPFIQSVYEKYKSKGIEVIGISVKDSKESPIEFQKATGISFHLVYNGRETAKRYGISGVPFMYLLDKNHNLNKVWAGYDPEYDNSIKEAVEKITTK